jgi:hypothetical protein
MCPNSGFPVPLYVTRPYLQITVPKQSALTKYSRRLRISCIVSFTQVARVTADNNGYDSFTRKDGNSLRLISCKFSKIFTFKRKRFNIKHCCCKGRMGSLHLGPCIRDLCAPHWKFPSVIYLPARETSISETEENLASSP